MKKLLKLNRQLILLALRPRVFCFLSISTTFLNCWSPSGASVALNSLNFGKEYIYLKFKIDHWHRPWERTGGYPLDSSKHYQGSPSRPSPNYLCTLSPACLLHLHAASPATGRHSQWATLPGVPGTLQRVAGCSRFGEGACHVVFETGFLQCFIYFF